MQKNLFIITVLFLLNSCFTQNYVPPNRAETTEEQDNNTQQALLDNNTFQLSGVSTDATYGYTEHNAIKVGGKRQGPLNERRFLNALLGPQGQKITYKRTGSCCPFKTPNANAGSGLLDVFEITYEGLENPIKLYINMYDYAPLKAPKGFSYAR